MLSVPIKKPIKVKLMKYLKKVLLASSLLLSAFAANAALITQDIFIEVDEFLSVGFTSADNGLFGSIQYESDDVVGGIATTDLSALTFTIDFAGLFLQETDDDFFGDPFLGPFAETDPFAPESGANALTTSFSGADFFGFVAGTDVTFEIGDPFGQSFEVLVGTLSFSDPITGQVSEPSVLALFSVALLMLVRRRLR